MNCHKGTASHVIHFGAVGKEWVKRGEEQKVLSSTSSFLGCQGTEFSGVWVEAGKFSWENFS